MRNIENELVKFHKEDPKYGQSIDFRVCKRETWGAVPPAGPGFPLQHPVSNVRYTDTKTATCVNPKDCFFILQNLQRKHMEEEHYSDIKFNFLVGGDGTIYEGRGWHVDNDRPDEFNHLKGKCIDIGYIGNIDDDDPHKEDFVKPITEQMGYAWAVYGQQDNNYITPRFSVIQ